MCSDSEISKKLCFTTLVKRDLKSISNVLKHTSKHDKHVLFLGLLQPFLSSFKEYKQKWLPCIHPGLCSACRSLLFRSVWKAASLRLCMRSSWPLPLPAQKANPLMLHQASSAGRYSSCPNVTQLNSCLWVKLFLTHMESLVCSHPVYT